MIGKLEWISLSVESNGCISFKRFRCNRLAKAQLENAQRIN